MTGPVRLSPSSLIAALSSSISVPSREMAGMLPSASLALHPGNHGKYPAAPAATTERQKRRRSMTPLLDVGLAGYRELNQVLSGRA
jgi:hypothetical protein